MIDYLEAMDEKI